MPSVNREGPLLVEAGAAEREVGFWRRFGRLFGLGAIGVLGLIPIAVPAARQRLADMPELEIPLGTFVALSLLNPVVILAISVAVGVRLAHRVGLRSYIDERGTTGAAIVPRLASELPLALLLGAAGGTTLVLLDLALAPWIAPGLADLEQAQPPTIWLTLSGMLYGGIVEELMLRWGLMTFLAWAAWKLVARGQQQPGAGVMWGAIVGSAVAFGVGHLPAVAALTPLTTPLILRTVGLNALGGLVFGWLFWRRSLEAAMVSHATFHVVFAVFSLFG